MGHVVVSRVQKKSKTKDIVNVQKTSLGARLRSLRRAKDLTQKYIADTLGLKRPAYNAYELGVTTPPPDKLAKLAELFGVTTDYLLGRELSPLVVAVMKQPLTYALHQRIDELVARTNASQQVTLLSKLDEWEKSL